MRIYNREQNKPIKTLGLLLPLDEAKVLIEELKLLVREPEKYVIIFKGKDKNGNLTKEITIRVYSKETIDKFDLISKELIKTGNIPTLH